MTHKTEIAWRSDVAAAPKGKRVLMIAVPIVPSHIGGLPELVVAHWYEGTERWVVVNVEGESRDGARLELKQLYWADPGEMPLDVELRQLGIGDFKG